MLELSKEAVQERIVKNVAALLNDTERTFVLNLGVGMPTLVSNYITNENIYIEAENGMLGVGAIATGDDIHPQLINSSRQPVLETAGCCFLDSSTSFGMIRGGYVDATVLGAFEVDQEANVANWIIPGGKQLGVGGAMDLVSGANTVIISMTHTSKDGKAKLVKKCSLPITGVHEVDIVVTELAIFHFREGKAILTHIAPDTDLDYIKTVTELEFEVAPDLALMIG